MKISIKNDLEGYGVGVGGPNDAGFNAELAQYVGEQNYDEVIPLVDSVKPLALFLKNDSSKEIVGIALRWQFTDTYGEINESNQIESTPGVLMGMKPLDPFMIGKTSLINPKSSRFITYFQSVGMSIENFFKSNRSKRFEYKLDHNQAQRHAFDIQSQRQFLPLKGASAVSVVVDAIIFNDGTFVGENRTFFFELMNGSVQARRDFLRQLRDTKQIGKDDANMLDDFISEVEATKADPIRWERKPSNGK